MEIVLKDTQKQILSAIAQSKQVLEQEYQKLVGREQELVASILEAKDYDPREVTGVTIVDGKILFEVKQPVPPAEEIKLKKVKK
jgi:hypothetical protein